MNNVFSTRFKMIGLIGASTILIIINKIVILSLLFMIIIGFNLIKMSSEEKRKRIVVILGFSFLASIFQVLFNTMIPLTARIYFGIQTTTILVSLSLIVFIFTDNTSPSSIISALSFLPKQLLLMLTITLSLIPEILGEISHIRLVQKTRGYPPDKFSVIPTIIPILNPLFYRTLRRAELIAMTMETR